MAMHTKIPRSEDDTERGLYRSGLLRTRRHHASKKWRVALTLLIIFVTLAIVGGCMTLTVLNHKRTRFSCGTCSNYEFVNVVVFRSSTK